LIFSLKLKERKTQNGEGVRIERRGSNLHNYTLLEQSQSDSY